jgi:hypothetical protein
MIKEDPHIEKSVADTILQKGVAIKVPAPFLIRLFKKTIQLTITSPFEGTMHRVARYYLSTGLTVDKLEGITVEQALHLHLKHSKAISKAVAVAVLNGYLKGMLFTKILAWYLRWHCSPQILMQLVAILVVHGGTQDFITITKSVRKMKLTTPSMGQQIKGS